MILACADVLSRASMPLGPSLRAARHQTPARVAWFGLDRALRTLEKICPARLHATVESMLRRRSPSRSALAAWGALPASGRLAPRGTQDHEERPQWLAPGRSALAAERLHHLDAWIAHAIRDPVAGRPILARTLEDHWDRCRPGTGAAWHPFPTARRTLHLLRFWASLEAQGGVAAGLDAALVRHTRAAAGLLPLRLERHSRGNHLLTELCALACSARVWGVPSADWSLDALCSASRAQFLGGGGHLERSPRYHLDVVGDLIDVLAAWGDALPPRAAELRGVVARGLGFAGWMVHGDGDVALFNDGALGDGPSLEALCAAARSVGIEPVGGPPEEDGWVCFREEGFVVSHRGPVRILADVGPVSADEQPAHAHCDILSFELSDGPRRVVGNRGTQAYSGPERAAARGTAAHSTVQIDDLEQAEMFGDFRVGLRASPTLLDASDCAGGETFAGRFAWPTAPGNVHERRWSVTDESLVSVVDRVVVDLPERRTRARFHLPGATDVTASAKDVEFRVDGNRYLLSSDAPVVAFPAPWHPRPGVSRSGWTVEVEPPAGELERSWTTVLRRAGAP